MKYCIDNDLKRSFEENHFVLLQGLLTREKAQELCLLVEKQVPKRDFAGRNLAIASKDIRDILFTQAIGSIEKALCGKTKLRYGTDWVWQGSIVPWSKAKEAISLASMVSVRPAILGCIIALTDGALEENVSSSSEFVLPAEAGDALFFDAEAPFIWENLHATSLQQKYLLLLLAGERALYVLNPEDASTHFLKSQGLVFGDRLPENTHPLLVR